MSLYIVYLGCKIIPFTTVFTQCCVARAVSPGNLYDFDFVKCVLDKWGEFAVVKGIIQYSPSKYVRSR